VTAAGLDELILKLNRAFKMTIVVVTHELESVFKIADHIIMLDLGEVIFRGTLDELRKSGDERIKMFLQRKPEQVKYTPEDYFKIIAGD
jgi:phospholipid/cholesterol/gamma-HCH transport system ATP-binding protein